MLEGLDSRQECLDRMSLAEVAEAAISARTNLQQVEDRLKVVLGDKVVEAFAKLGVRVVGRLRITISSCGQAWVFGRIERVSGVGETPEMIDAQGFEQLGQRFVEENPVLGGEFEISGVGEFRIAITLKTLMDDGVASDGRVVISDESGGGKVDSKVELLAERITVNEQDDVMVILVDGVSYHRIEDIAVALGCEPGNVGLQVAIERAERMASVRNVIRGEFIERK